MKNKLMRKAAEVKSAVLSKDAAQQSTETVILIVAVVVIALGIAWAIKAILGDDKSGLLNTVKTKLDDFAKNIQATTPGIGG